MPENQTTFETFDVLRFLDRAGLGKMTIPYHKADAIYAQGGSCATLFFIREGTVKLTVVSVAGKQATIALLGAGDFAGEECLSTAQQFRTATATALTDCILLRIDKTSMIGVLREDSELSALFIAYLLARTSRIQADLVDQLFNSTEKRLARTLLLLANFGKEGAQETLVPQISQETLAAMVGCTRPRVNFFLNRFRKLGFIEYSDRIQVHKSLLQVILHD